MIKHKYPNAFLCLLFLVTFNTFSQFSEFSSLTIPPELKENANAVVRNSTTEITIEEVNRMVVSKRVVVTVLNKLGNSDAGIYESYDDDTKITNLSAIIYDALGSEIKKFKERDFLDVSAVDGGTLYSDARVKYIDYTPISYPYTLVFETEYKTSTTGFIPWWVPVNGYYVSVEKSSYVLKNPNAIPWRIKETNFNDYNVEKNDSETELNYTLLKQTALEYENQSPAYRDILPIAKVALDKFTLKGVYGEATNWQEFGKWMHDSLLAGRDIIDDATKSNLLDLVKDAKTDLEKTKIVYEYMQNKTRYISVQVGIGGWEPIAANQVDQVGYGDCKGLSNYTKALLDVVGVTSYYTVVYAQERRDLDKDFSSIQGNHVILNVPNNGNDIWLECTSQTMPFGFLGDFTDDRNVLVITPEGGVIKRTASYKDDVNLQTIKGEIELSETGDVKANLKRISKGIQYDDKSYFDSYTDEELIKNYKSDVWSYNNNLEVDSFKLNNDKENVVFTEDLGLSIKNFASVNETEYLFRVNIFNRESYIPKRYRKRNLPLKISRGYKDVDEYTIKIPASYKLEYIPENKELSTKFGTYKISFHKIDESTFSYKKEILMKEGVHPKEDYKAYRSFRRSIAKSENLRIALIKK
ncbi:DUF3857 domain-containing protein [Polaribacter reichenbachii]|uniref:DUF3857 domain-containing protein n=1 Tax=Polaribacter reichenbachii TaxID=996801 RepID=A0A1B8U7G8_9FLAO|nr:DUF3857 domain-containing protein [Polaribacter reichenbachii]APZ46412.1 DUF3857 domain-containing protein [Polaribacter reichenbachii]AUC20277.1 DUF3857 domain-containing protein [Polaribacter reichenbachii]OBY67825.1 hypothetical protein LPB301_00575 [Polaribacter reichenbachii]